jgi:hypothetical protein
MGVYPCFRLKVHQKFYHYSAREQLNWEQGTGNGQSCNREWAMGNREWAMGNSVNISGCFMSVVNDYN